MNSVRVYIATTEGPAEIQRITEEDPGIKSVVCLDSKAMALPISAGYDAFVREPTGVIEKCFGHSAFRMDVSRHISEGMSWQLGVFAAHALFSAGRLAGKREAAAQAIWLTGEVNRDLEVGAVDHVAEKLRRSGRLFSKLETDGIPVMVFLPREDFTELDESWLREHGIGTQSRRIVPVDGAGDLFCALGLDEPTPPRESKIRPEETETTLPLRLPAARTALVMGGLAVLAVLLGVTAWRSGVADWLALAEGGDFGKLDAAFSKVENDACSPCKLILRGYQAFLASAAPYDDDLALVAVETRAPEGKSCAAVHFGTAEPEVVEVARSAAGQFKAISARGLCALEYRLTNRDGPAYVWAVVSEGEGYSTFVRTKPSLQGYLMSEGSADSLRVELRRRIKEPLTYRILVIASARPFADVLDWLAREVTALGPRLDAVTWAGLQARLENGGVTVLSPAHEITP